MKKQRIARFFGSLKQTIKIFPVEFGILLYAFVMGALLYEEIICKQDQYAQQLALVPLFFSLSYVLNNLIKCPRGRWAYYLSWLIIIPFWWVDIEPWLKSAGYFVSLAVALLSILVCRRTTDNTRFTTQSLRYVVNLIVAGIFASTAWSLLVGIYYSIAYFFNLDWNNNNFFFYSTMLAYVIALPLMFLAFNSSNLDKEWKPTKFLDILLNYIITPALLVYTAILYAYFVKIAVAWSLPQGLVATMVLAFAVVAIIAKACQPLLGKRHFGWFFNNFSLISLPALIMFWVSVLYRISAYGLTELRVYLLLGCVVMTYAILMFVFKGKGRYYTVVLLAIGLLALFTYLPFMSAKHIAYTNQHNRVERAAERLGMLDENGEFLPFDQMPAYDSTLTKDYEIIYNSLDHIYGSKYNTFGDVSTHNFNRHYPFDEQYDGTAARSPRQNIEYSVYLYSYLDSRDISDYNKMVKLGTSSYSSHDYCYYEVDNRTLTVFRRKTDIETDADAEKQYDTLLTVSYADILASGLAKAGLSADSLPAKETLSQHREALTNYEFDGGMLIFSSLDIEKYYSGKGEISYLHIDYLLLK